MSNKSDSEMNRHIGQMLKTARKACNVSQAEIALATGMTKNHISAIERGVSKASIELLFGYCKKLEMTPDKILGFNGEEIKNADAI